MRQLSLAPNCKIYVKTDSFKNIYNFTLTNFVDLDLCLFPFLYCRSTPCPNVKHGDEWGDPVQCENGDNCGYCHTRTEQQFHPEVFINSCIYMYLHISLLCFPDVIGDWLETVLPSVFEKIKCLERIKPFLCRLPSS